MIHLDNILRALDAHTPTIAPNPGSAVAAILQGAETPHLLFIERARVNGDPWSGDIAFPGGRVEPQDTGLQAAAERETLEEIGLDLQQGHYLGRLDDLVTQTLGVQVAAFVYTVESESDFRLSPEVADAFWQPLSDLADPQRHRTHTFPHRGFPRRMPAIDLLGPDKPLLWGITYRFVAQLMRLAGQPLPELADQQ